MVQVVDRCDYTIPVFDRETMRHTRIAKATKIQLQLRTRLRTQHRRGAQKGGSCLDARAYNYFRVRNLRLHSELPIIGGLWQQLI